MGLLFRRKLLVKFSNESCFSRNGLKRFHMCLRNALPFKHAFAMLKISPACYRMQCYDYFRAMNVQCSRSNI